MPARPAADPANAADTAAAIDPAALPRQLWPQELAARYRALGYWRGESFGDLLRAKAAAHPRREALTAPDAALSYAGLLQEAERIAGGLLDLGLRPGERVLLQLPNSAAFLTAAFGLFLAGLLPVFALPAHRLTELRHFASRSGARAIITAARHEGFDYAAMACTLRDEMPGVAHVIVAGAAPEAGRIGLEALQRGAQALPAVDPAGVAFLQISGGSTGLSKLIPRTHDDYLYSCRASAEICGLGADSVYMATLPAAHNFPMSSPGVFGTLAAGGRVVMCPRPDPETAFALIAAEGVTITGIVPPLALLWMEAAPGSAHDLSSLETLQVGGAKFIPEAAARVSGTLGCRLQQVFGMAEGLVNYTRPEDPDEIVTGTQGRPISPDDELRIVDDADRPVPEGEPGHLLTRGPYTIRAYHNEPEANARSFTADGFYRTGDIVRRLPSGHLVVQGRAGDHINRAGEKVSAEEVEDHLIAHPGIFDAAVVSIPDPALGERSCAFVIPAPGAAALRPAEVRAFVRGRGIAAFKVPDRVVIVDRFETTAVGKISRKTLRAQLRAALMSEETQP